MTLLEKAIELYVGIMAARPKNDSMYLQFKDFVVMHFGHEGTRAMDAADEQPIVYTYKNQAGSGGRTLRAFEHPLNAPKPQPDPEPQPQTNVPAKDPATPPKPKGKDNKGGNTTQSKELADKHAKDAQKQAAANAGKQNSPSHSQTKTADVAPDNATTGDVVGQVDVDVELVKTMRAKAVGALYPDIVMRLWLEHRGVVLSGKESRTQLGALILQYAEIPQPNGE